MSPTRLVDHFFRHEYGRLVSTLVRRFGIRYITDVEDAVQSALEAALDAWRRDGVPDEPSAWLSRVSSNRLIQDLRQVQRRRELLDECGVRGELEEPAADADDEADLLRMLFVCCDPTITVESQRILALKVLCGFSTREIAGRLFMSEGAVYKRLNRGRLALQELPVAHGERPMSSYQRRVPVVREVLYVLFSEGHQTTDASDAIRKELCSEAIRLATILAGQRVGAEPETFALLALMHLHAARIPARRDGPNELVLLEEQDRSRWDCAQIALGLSWLQRSAQGTDVTQYHLEAAIAAEHCLAPTFGETRWDRIVETYGQLESTAPSLTHRLNRAVATAEWKDAQAGLSVLQGLEHPKSRAATHLFAAVHADLHRRAGNRLLSDGFFQSALETAPNDAVRAQLRRRMA